MIDLSRQPPRDAYPMVRFRRTDQDRRPARVVQRPNDGPGSWERREALAQEVAAKLKAKVGSETPLVSQAVPKRTTQGAGFYSAEREKLAIDQSALLTLLSLNDEVYSLRGLQTAMQFSEHRITKLVNRLVEAGHIHKAVTSKRVGQVAISSAGRAHLVEVTS
jgi:hypothetical protein